MSDNFRMILAALAAAHGRRPAAHGRWPEALHRVIIPLLVRFVDGLAHLEGELLVVALLLALLAQLRLGRAAVGCRRRRSLGRSLGRTGGAM